MITKEKNLPVRTSPNKNYYVRALDDSQNKVSVLIPMDSTIPLDMRKYNDIDPATVETPPEGEYYSGSFGGRLWTKDSIGNVKYADGVNQFRGYVAPTDSAPANLQNGDWVRATATGTYTNFSGVSANAGNRLEYDLANTTWLVYDDSGSGDIVLTSDGDANGHKWKNVGNGVDDGDAANINQLVQQFPYANTATFYGSLDKTVLKKSILDVEIKGGDPSWRTTLFTFERNGTNGWYIRLAVYDEAGVLITGVGDNGIIAFWIEATHTEPTLINGRRIEKIELTPKNNAVDSATIVVDWEAIPDGGNVNQNNPDSYELSPLIFYDFRAKTVNYVTADGVYSNLPETNAKIWNLNNTFSIFPELRDAILDVKLFGSVDIGKDYAIGQARIADDGTRNFIGIYEYDAITGAIGTKVALWDANPSYTFPTSEGGRQIDTVTLAEQNSSGITAQLTIDFAKMPAGVTNPPDNWDVENFRFAVNLLRGVDPINIEGSITLTFQVNGVNSQIITPTAYSDTGKPSYCLMYCHGNGGSYTDAGSVNFKNFCKANNIAIITTQGQDEVSAPFTTNASGWGNYVQLQRYIALYKYAMDNYNLSPNIIISAGSMGGLVAGQLMYNKPFPITAAFLAGPVPDLSYIFANGGASRYEAIRNAYGMAADGSDDANLETFIQGYDWYDMGLVDISGTKYKFGFPRIYIEVGNGDSTFSVDFGGTAKYMEIVNAIKAAGGYIQYHEISGVTHNADDCYDKFISDGLFEKELGI
jgi:hypothetical protein